MNNVLFKLRLSLALAATLALAACGGGSGLIGGYNSLPVQGSISGLAYGGLVLLNNGGDAIGPVAGATTFSFPNQIKIGSTYEVTLRSQPLHQTCTIANPSDTSGRTVSIAVVVTCSQNTYALGGTITGLTVDGLVLTNGADSLTLVAGTTSYVFAGPVPDGTVYGAVVWNNPPGLSCTMVNGTAIMGSANVTNANVTCVPAP